MVDSHSTVNSELQQRQICLLNFFALRSWLTDLQVRLFTSVLRNFTSYRSLRFIDCLSNEVEFDVLNNNSIYTSDFLKLSE